MKINELLKEKAQELPERVAVYVPGTVDTNKADPEAAAKMAGYTAEQLTKFFGGATSTDAAGYWMSDGAGLVVEDVKIIYSNATAEQIDENAENLLDLAELIKKEMSQDAVSLEISGKLYII